MLCISSFTQFLARAKALAAAKARIIAAERGADGTTGEFS